MNVNATTCDSGTGSGDFTIRWTSRSTSSVVLPVPAPAVTTTFRSNVVAESVRACRSGISAATLLPLFLVFLVRPRLGLGNLERAEIFKLLRGVVAPGAPPALIVLTAADLGVVTMIAVAARQDEESAGLDPFEDERQRPPDSGTRLAVPARRIQRAPVHRPIFAIGREEIERGGFRNGRLAQHLPRG